MYKWVSVYFDENEYKSLEKVARLLKARGVKLSRYGMLKAWILRIIRKIEKGDLSWLEGLEEELEKGKVKARYKART